MWLIDSSIGRKVVMSVTGAAPMHTMPSVSSWELTGMHW